MSMNSINLTRDQIVTVLRQSIQRIVFTKNDGSERIMLATLNPIRLPPVDPNKPPRTERKHPEGPYVVVWDMEKGDWRVVNTDTIKEMTSFEWEV